MQLSLVSCILIISQILLVIALPQRQHGPWLKTKPRCSCPQRPNISGAASATLSCTKRHSIGPLERGTSETAQIQSTSTDVLGNPAWVAVSAHAFPSGNAGDSSPNSEAVESASVDNVNADSPSTAVAATPSKEASVSATTDLPPSSVPATTVTAAVGSSVQIVTITGIPAQQTPTVTSAVSDTPDTIGTVNPALDTSGHPGSFPFPTELPTVTESTLVPLNATAPFLNATYTQPRPTITNTLTLPVTTFESITTSEIITSIPVPTSATLTQVTVINSTFTSNGTAIVTSSVGVTVVTTNATGLVGITLTQVSTITGTESTTVTAGATFTGLPIPQASCIFSSCSGQDVFQPVNLGPPVAQIPARGGHPVPRLGITDTTRPIQTNKFFANIFLGTQGSPIFTMPYSLTWSRGSGNAQSWGMAISHLDDDQKVYGPVNGKIPGTPSSYYINPLGIQSIILSASELSKSSVMTSDSIAQFSANVKLQPASGSASSITFPLVQGMGFVTGLYTNLQPAIQSSIFFRSVTAAGSPRANVFKYRVVLEDDKTWLIYATSSSGLTPNLKLISSTLLEGIAGWSGVIQVAKVPSPELEALYDAACGAYAIGGAVSGYAYGTTAEYGITWTKSGPYADSASLLMFALPHHLESFGTQTGGAVSNLTLATTVKGTATAVVADHWIMVESSLPAAMGFAPWRPGQVNSESLSAAAISAIQKVAPIEASQDMHAQSNLDSMYFSGKALSKFASIIYVMNDLADQKNLSAAALVQLKAAFTTFRDNKQQFPLLYDTDWKGVVSSASYVTGNPGVDFGNSYYNDHHFHYGYFIHAAAVIGYLDPTWLSDNKDYVNTLVRDVANPSALDQYFPVFRSFDWYHGHSWAKGLYESGDGKDQESSSEDAMFAYALKMWGKTCGDRSMEARGNLMLSVLARSFNNYFLMSSTNKNQPKNFIANKVTGILFENKVDHTTYFGGNLEYVQGIHMLPLQPFSTMTRPQSFVVEEWNAYFRDGDVAQAVSVRGGWKGILYANLALINSQASYNFFTQPDFDASWLDGGASRTWYIAFAAGLGGSGQ